MLPSVIVTVINSHYIFIFIQISFFKCPWNTFFFPPSKKKRLHITGQRRPIWLCLSFVWIQTITFVVLAPDTSHWTIQEQLQQQSSKCSRKQPSANAFGLVINGICNLCHTPMHTCTQAQTLTHFGVRTHAFAQYEAYFLVSEIQLAVLRCTGFTQLVAQWIQGIKNGLKMRGEKGRMREKR